MYEKIIWRSSQSYTRQLNKQIATNNKLSKQHQHTQRTEEY